MAGRPVHRALGVAGHTDSVRAVRKRRQSGLDRRPDVPGGQGRHPAGPAVATRAAGADGGISGGRIGDAPGLVGDIAR